MLLKLLNSSGNIKTFWKNFKHTKDICLFSIYRSSDTGYALFTLLFLFLPFIYALIRDIVNFIRRKKRAGQKAFEFYYHFPFMQVLKYYLFIIEINCIVKQIKKLKKQREIVLDKIDEKYGNGSTIKTKKMEDLVKDLKLDYNLTKKLLSYVLGDIKFKAMEKDLIG